MVTITYRELANRLDVVKLFNKAPELDDAIIELVYASLGKYEEDEEEKLWKDEEDEEDIFQWYLISASDAEYLQRVTDELVFYSDVLDEYVWAITHYGTPWDEVTLEIKNV